ncbi:MAG TPA: rhodanese-like domain-containing protein [Pyrinomonadaceae bacterium]|nr:rhodanese-like domain-containing protein [Pyrinomonadaceae bacterium]
MKKKITPACVPLLVLLVCVGGLLTGCETQNQTGKDSQANVTARESQSPAIRASPSDGVRRVAVSELKDAMGKGQAVVVDVRGGVEYNLGHIEGALSMPLGLVAERAGELPRDKLIVTYCA